MNKYLTTIFFTIIPLLCLAQQNTISKYLDSLSSEIDNDNTLITNVISDSIGSSKDSTIKVYTYHIKQKGGLISKIKETGSGNCKLNIDYYFSNRNLFKIVLRSGCIETRNWNSMFYFENGKSIYQIDYGTPLYAPAFKQLADSLVKRFQQ